MAKIHIIGAGLSGLSAAYYCQKELGLPVLLYDKGDKKGASFVGSGLVHPFAGPKGLLSEKGFEAMDASRSLIDIAQQALASHSIVLANSLYRVAMNGFQKSMFGRWSRRMPDLVRKLTEDEILAHGSLQEGLPIYEIKCGLSINMPRYLEGLAKAFESAGGTFVKEWIDKEEFPSEDIVVYATGHHLHHFPQLNSLDTYLSKGQLLVIDKPAGLNIDIPILGKGYVSRGEGDSIVIGATYETPFTTEAIDKAFAISDIMPKIEKFVKLSESIRVRDVRSGIRVINKDYYFPIAKKLSKREYVIGAMGSRGLLYHAMLGKQIADLIASDKGI